MRFPHPIRQRRIRQSTLNSTIGLATLETITDKLYAYPIRVQHTVTYTPRPPAPRPTQLLVMYEMQNGFQYRTYIPLNGQAYSQESWPHWLNPEAQGSNWPPVKIEYHLTYRDGGTL